MRFPVRPAALTGLGMLTTLVCVSVAAPWIVPYDPAATVGLPFQPPSWAHLLGTNDLGQDILSELVVGSRASLLTGFLAAGTAVLLGTAVGVLAGYSGGAVDALLMRLVDLVLVIPFLPLTIVLAAYLGPRFWNIVLTIAALTWARPARVIRAQVLSLRTLDYVVAARALGASTFRILTRHILPGVLPLTVAQFVTAASHAILVEASLSFLGLGDPTMKSWGSTLYYAQARSAFLSGAWRWWVLPPGFLVAVSSLSFALLGLALEERWNPRLRQMHQRR